MKKLLTISLILTALLYSSPLLWRGVGGEAFSQSQAIDSMQQALKNYDAEKLEEHKNLLPGESDTTKIKMLNDLSWEFLSIADFESANKYAHEGLALSQQLHFRKGIADAYIIIGTVYYAQDNYPEALKNHFAALKIREEANDKKGIAGAYGNIGNVCYSQGNYPEALKNYFAGLKIFEETGDKNGIGRFYSNIGNIYSDQGNLPEALKNYLASLKIFEETGDKSGIAGAYSNIGTIYSDQGNYPEALKNYFASLKIREETGAVNDIADSYIDIGSAHFSQDNYPEAMKDYSAALKIQSAIGDKNGMAVSYINIGNIHVKMQNARQAKEWLDKGLKLSQEIGSIDVIRNAYKSLAETDSVLGDFKEAFENHKQYILYRDSLVNGENIRKMVQSRMQYEFDKKQAADNLKFAQEKELGALKLQKQKAVTYGGFAGTAVTVILLFFVYRNYSKQRIANQKLKEAQEQLIKSEKMAAFGMMASRVSHEIQNPLNFVNNFSDLAEEMVNDIVKLNSEQERNETAKDLINNLQKIKHHGMRADAIVKQLQEHTRAGTAHEYFDENKS